jgi:4a-hydroxytetrahydrobiopterin dehydratase
MTAREHGQWARRSSTSRRAASSRGRSEHDVTAALDQLPLWSGGADGIERTLELPSFRAAAEAVSMIADVAEQLDHHPDMDLRWTKLRVAVVTHSAGGLTELDLELARRVDVLFPG